MTTATRESASYSLLPIDCGFCPRLLRLTVLLPAAARSVRYRFARANSTASGPTAGAVAAQLRRAGYRVRVIDSGPLAFERA